MKTSNPRYKVFTEPTTLAGRKPNKIMAGLTTKQVGVHLKAIPNWSKTMKSWASWKYRKRL
jgi:hypothetical protein